MRTTVTLDPDVVVLLREEAHRRGTSVTRALNDAVRAGLGAAASGPRAPYRVPARPLGLRPAVDLDRALAAASELEDAEIVRTLDLRA